MKEPLDILFELIREELWQSEVFDKQTTINTFPQILKLAGEQCVQGLVINSLFRRNADIGRNNVYKCLSVKQQIANSNKKLNDALEKLADVLNIHNIRYVVFKGQTAAAYYPDPSLRMPGDIDFYCADCDYLKAQDAITKDLGVTFDKRDIVDRHDSFNMDGVRFEMHYKMEILGSSNHQKHYDNIMTGAVSSPLYLNFGKTKVATLSPTFNVLHILKHLFNHLLVEGVALRQFCDLAIIIGKTSDCIDVDLLEHSLKAIGYWKAFLASGAFVVKYLGLPTDKFPYSLSSKDFKWGERILTAILEHGNFGRYNRKRTNSRILRSMETAEIAFGHCFTFFLLAPSDIVFLVPKRISTTLRQYCR